MCTYSRKEYDFGSTSSARAGSSSFSSVSRGPTRQPSVLTLMKAGGWSWVCRRKLASRWVERSGATSWESCPPGWCEEKPVSSWRVRRRAHGATEEVNKRTYDDSAFTPASIPMAADVADPIALSPDTWADRNLRVELDAHLKVAFEGRFRDGIGARRGGRVTLEAIDHGVKVTLLRSLVGGGDWGTIDCFVQDWVVRIMFLHCAEVIGTLK